MGGELRNRIRHLTRREALQYIAGGVTELVAAGNTAEGVCGADGEVAGYLR